MKPQHFLLTLLLSLPLLVFAQNQALMDQLLKADAAVNTCKERIPSAEKSLSPFAGINYKAAREPMLEALQKIEAAYSSAEASFDASRKALKLAKKLKCDTTYKKAIIARDHFNTLRFELDEARQQLMQMELSWLKVKEQAIELAQPGNRDPDVIMEDLWSKITVSYYINSAELALLNAYPAIKTGKLALEEAILALCE